MPATSMLLLTMVPLLLQLISAVQGDTKIIGGSDTDITQLPYQVSLRLRRNEQYFLGGGHICGGAVISNRMIVTAAHCFYNIRSGFFRNAAELQVVMGDTYLRYKSRNSLTFSLEKAFLHPQFKMSPINNDIALLFIKGVIPSSSLVKPLALNDKVIGVDTSCIVSGWGSTSIEGEASNSLKSAVVKVISRNVCESSYGHLSPKVLCAGYMRGGIDSCQGDSGGPLKCGDTLVGVVSFGKGCALRNYPGVYTDVRAYLDWIRGADSTRSDEPLDFACQLEAFHCICLTVLAMFVAVG